MSISSKKIISRIVSTASSAVRTSVTSWYIWSGISQSFWKTSPLGDLARRPASRRRSRARRTCAATRRAGARTASGRTRSAAARRSVPVLAAVDDDRLLGGELQRLLRRSTSWWTRGSNQTSAGPGRCSCRPSRKRTMRNSPGWATKCRIGWKRVPPAPDAPRPDDDLHRPVRPPHEDALAFLDDVGEHARASHGLRRVESGGLICAGRGGPGGRRLAPVAARAAAPRAREGAGGADSEAGSSSAYEMRPPGSEVESCMSESTDSVSEPGRP